MIESPLILTDNDCSLFGVLRTSETSKKIVIFVPAITGTRTGPQNIYVSIARSLIASDISTLCIELPPAGDSFDNPQSELAWPDGEEELFARYSYYLEKIHGYLLKNYPFNEYYVATISISCLPVLKFCFDKRLAGAVLLSPVHFDVPTPVIDKSNLKSYLLKLFMAKTWKKLFLLKINYKKIFKNVFNIPSGKKNKPATNKNNMPQTSVACKILCIFGEMDSTIQDSLKYWNSLRLKDEYKNLDTKIISGADHSFFRWPYKQEVSNYIDAWMTKN